MDFSNSYLLEIKDCGGFEYNVLIEGEDKLANFLVSFDKEEYYISKDIITLTGYIDKDYKMFIKNEDGLELGTTKGGSE